MKPVDLDALRGWSGDDIIPGDVQALLAAAADELAALRRIAEAVKDVSWSDYELRAVPWVVELDEALAAWRGDTEGK